MAAAEPVILAQPYIAGGSDMGALIQAKNWASTALGETDHWPLSLRTMVNVCLNSRFPMLIWWGKDLVKIYNDAYRPMLGNKHPSALGAGGADVWPEIWHIIGPMLRKVLDNGEATWSENQLLLLERNGYPEECYFTYSYSPIYEESGAIGGVFTAVTETTLAVINESRLRTLGSLAGKFSGSQKPKDIYRNILEVLKDNPADIPFSMLYEVAEVAASATLIGTSGIITPHDSVPEKMDFGKAMIGSRNFLKCVQTGESVYVNDVRQRLGDMPGGSWNQPPEEAYILPIKKAGIQHPYAVLVIGINPHRRFDDPYQQFLQLIADHIATEVSDVLSYAAEVAIRKRTEDSQRQIYNLIMQAPVAMAVLKGPNFIVDVANAKALQFWGRSGNMVLNKPLFNSFPDVNAHDFQEKLMQVYNTGVGFYSAEYAARISRNGKIDHIYIAFALEPFKEMDGTITGLMLVANDVTAHVNSRKKIEESEERLKLAIHLTRLGTWDCNLATGELNWSDECRRIYDYPLGEKVDISTFESIIHPDDKEWVLQHISTVMNGANGGMYENIYRIIRFGDKAERWIKSSGRVYFNADGRPETFIGTILDVTEEKEHASELEQKVAERTRELQNRKDFIEVVINSSIVLMAAFDIDTRIIAFNKKCESVFGISADYAIGKLFHDVFPGIEKSATYRHVHTALKGEPVHSSRYRSVINDRYYESFFVPLYNSDNNVYAALMTAHDITDIVESTQKLEELNQELLKSNLDLEQFAYIASHDLQEPLRKIQIFTQMLQRNLDNNNAAKFHVEKINVSAQRMSELIKSVLNYSRLSKNNINFEEVDLNAVAAMLHSDFELIIAEKNAELLIGNLPTIKGMPLQLMQLFSNLVSNALKFSSEQPVIRISARQLAKNEAITFPDFDSSRKYVEISVSDNGIGFEQVYTDRIFTIFQRLNERSVYDGTGIGLALCKKIAENHKGFITAKSQPGKGATFLIYLPLG